jgi:soluble lytic murein transglycosylase-like protein
MHGMSSLKRCAFAPRRDDFFRDKGETMIHRFIGTSARLVQHMASQPVTWSSVIKAARGVLTTAQHTLTVFGLSAVAMIALLYSRPDFAKRVSDFLSPQHAAPAQVAANPAVQLVSARGADAVEIANSDDKAASGPTRQQKYVTDWLSRRYRVAGDAANMLVSTAYSTAHEIKLDPLLILAVMAIESGLNPFAESPMGAQGLMQVMSKVHSDKFEEVGGSQAALNPVANIRVGALILKDYVKRTGSVEGALKSYVGAAAADDDSGYGSKVLTEYKRLKQVASGKNVPIYFPPAPAAAPATTLAQKSAPAPAKPDTASAEAAHGGNQSGETVAGL